MFPKSGFSKGRVPKYKGFSQDARKKFSQGRHTLSYSREFFSQYQIPLLSRLIEVFHASSYSRCESVACNDAL